MNSTDGERYDAIARELAEARAEIERLQAAVATTRGHGETMPCGHNSRWLVYGNPVDVDSEQHCLFCENERLRAFRDAVYESIIENAGLAFSSYAYIKQPRWEEIKAAEKGQCDEHSLATSTKNEANDHAQPEPPKMCEMPTDTITYTV